MHNNVVRAFSTGPAAATGTGTVTLPIPDGCDRTEGAVIAYVQQAATQQVLGAGRQPVQ